MTGAELLALARHNRGAGEGDAETALHLAQALSWIWWSLTTHQKATVARVLQQLLAEDMIRRNVRNDYSNLQARTNS